MYIYGPSRLEDASLYRNAKKPFCSKMLEDASLHRRCKSLPQCSKMQVSTESKSLPKLVGMDDFSKTKGRKWMRTRE
jgi:hypothetical protein